MIARFTTVARKNLAEALDFHERCKKGSSGEFIDDLERTLSYLYQFPFSGRGIGSSLRILPVGFFPYTLVYQPNVDEILVLAITDEEHPAEYWLKRASK